MRDSPDSSSSRLYSSRLTEKLANEAEMLLFSGGLTEIDLDDKFEEIKEKAKSALTDGTGLTEDLLELAELISQNGGDISIDGSYQLNLSEDKMSITLSIKPPIGNGKEVTYENIITELKKRKITRGVCINAIRQAVDDASNGKEVNDTVVVRGTPPIPGAAPWVVYFGRITDHELDEVTEDHLTFENDEPVLCEEGDTIAYIREGDGGMPGYTQTELSSPRRNQRIESRSGRGKT